MFKNLFSLLLLVGIALSVDWYVDVGGGGTICTQASPCADLKTAISKVNSKDRILVNSGTYTGPSNLLGSGLTIKELTIMKNPSATSKPIFNLNRNQFFNGHSNNTGLLLDGLVFTKGYGYSGGVIYISHMSGNFTFTNCEFNWNQAGSGGAVFMYGVNNVDFISCSFANNSAIYGGALFGNTANMNLTGTNFTGNYADDSGGAIYFSRNTMIIADNCYVFNNSALKNGGFAYLYDYVDLYMNHSTFLKNSATNSGGVMTGFQVHTEFSQSSFLNNTVRGWGAAFRLYGSYSGIRCLGCFFKSNTGASQGGAIDLQSSANAQLETTELAFNSASRGGAFSVLTGSRVNLSSCSVHNNEANWGGAFYLTYNGILLINNETRIYDNMANFSGGFADCGDSSISISSDAIIGDNTAVNASNAQQVFCNPNPPHSVCAIDDNRDPPNPPGFLCEDPPAKKHHKKPSSLLFILSLIFSISGVALCIFCIILVIIRRQKANSSEAVISEVKFTSVNNDEDEYDEYGHLK